LTSITLPTFYQFSRSVRLATPAVLLAVAIAGCAPADQASGARGLAQGSAIPSLATSSTPTKTPAASPTDYRRLLLTAADLSDAEDTFTQRSQTPQPNGLPGASAFFVNDKDNRAIIDTVLIYPDAKTATATLQQATGQLAAKVVGGEPKPLSVGTDGVVVVGTYPDEDKAVTLLTFTEGKALVRVEFQSATGDPTTERFVTNVGKMQQIALRIGLDESQ
jgi:hypothetical protein